MVWFWLRRVVLVALLSSASGVASGTGEPQARVGLPLTRTYALEDIGGASRAAHLGFDSAGRLAVVSGNGYFVLNDSTWLDLTGARDEAGQMSRVATDEEGRSYFGAPANWGLVEFDREGKLRLRSLRPDTVPDWVSASTFASIIPHARGALFAGRGGAVNWDRSTGQHTYFPVSGVTAIFTISSRFYISSFKGGTQMLDLEQGALEPASGELAKYAAVNAIALDADRTLISSLGGRTLVCDGTEVHDWSEHLPSQLTTPVSALERLPEGGVAMALEGRGLLLFSADGKPHMALTSPDYHRIQDLAAREPGVLWVVTENAVQKVLYGSAVTIVDQRLGVPVSWPHVVSWDGKTIISSSGQLFETAQASDGFSFRFDQVSDLPSNAAWSVAAAGPHLLIANEQGVYARNGGRFETVISDMDVGRLVMIGTDFCFAIGSREITAIHHIDGRWIEATPRIPGVGFPSIVHAAARSAWIEIGVGRVARVSHQDGMLHAGVFEDFPWKEPRWIQVGSVGEVVVLNGGSVGAVYFNETTGEFCEAPDIKRLMDSAPFPVMRLAMDDSGWIWATHDRGVFVAHRDDSQDSGFRFDTMIASDLRDFQPRVHFLDAGRVAVSTERTVYFVARTHEQPPRPPTAPLLTGIVDRRLGHELYSMHHDESVLSRFTYAQNNLLFRFFSGSYHSVRPVEYEFTLVGGSSHWSARGNDSHLDLRDLSEGSYQLTAQVLESTVPTRPSLTLTFQVAAPWYRSRPAYAGYAALVVLAGWTLMRWALGRARRRNASLEKIVRERTEELRTTMSQLSEETRATAIYAERTRLAGEIHDSVQQGLSGMMLQLGVTLKLPDLTSEAKSKLEIVRNMISFTRHEVQQAVWNLESPLLESTALPDALTKLASLISAGTPRIQVETQGSQPALPPPTKHNLLRIAQEAITNAVRHGNAQTIQVTLSATAAHLSLEIRDDGDGFAPQQALEKNAVHFGLRGMRARASKLGAEFRITSAPGAGTTVRVELPLAASSVTLTHAASA